MGVILNLAVWFSLHTLFGTVESRQVGPLSILWPDPSTVDWGCVLLAVGAGVALLRFRVPMPLTLAAAATLGLVWTLVGA